MFSLWPRFCSEVPETKKSLETCKERLGSHWAVGHFVLYQKAMSRVDHRAKQHPKPYALQASGSGGSSAEETVGEAPSVLGLGLERSGLQGSSRISWLRVRHSVHDRTMATVITMGSACRPTWPNAINPKP